jgi:hypothetical protein
VQLRPEKASTWIRGTSLMFESLAKTPIANLERFLPLIQHFIDFPEERHSEREYLQNRPRHGQQLDIPSESA